MADFMGHNADQLILAFHGLNQAGVEKDQAGRGGKSIKLAIFDHKKVIVKILRPCCSQHLPPKIINILGDIRIVDQLEFAAHRIKQLLADQPFIADTKTVRKNWQQKQKSRQQDNGPLKPSG